MIGVALTIGFPCASGVAVSDLPEIENVIPDPPARTRTTLKVGNAMAMQLYPTTASCEVTTRWASSDFSVTVRLPDTQIWDTDYYVNEPALPLLMET